MVEEPYDFDWSEWDAHVNKTLPNASKIIDTSRNLTDTKSLRFSFEKGLLELSNGGELIFKLLQFARIIIEGKVTTKSSIASCVQQRKHFVDCMKSLRVYPMQLPRLVMAL